MPDVSTHPPLRQVRASYDDDTIIVYQAYSVEIAREAVRRGTFGPPFKMDRMTWVKPSFLWMMYRCGWARKPGQERVLAISMSRTGFEAALADSCLSHFDPAVYADHDAWQRRRDVSPVTIQWDPERSPSLEPLPWRSLQIGLGGRAVHQYVKAWITNIEDISDQVLTWGAEPVDKRIGLPQERPYPLSASLAAIIGAS